MAASLRHPLVLLAVLAIACDEPLPPEPPPAPVEPPTPVAEPDPEPPALVAPVPKWVAGAIEGEVDAVTADEDGHLLLDLGESWTPYLFTERDGPDGERIPHGYRSTYLALARGEFPADHHGARARRDMYLELYGIAPTLGLLRERLRRVSALECAQGLDLGPLDAFEGFLAYANNAAARRQARRWEVLSRKVTGLVEDQGVASEEELDESPLRPRDRRDLREYRELRPERDVILAAQTRLSCEGFFEGKGRWVEGGFDWATHEALAEFERRHRIYGWGFIGRETIEALRLSPAELERRAIVRVLTERAMHALGVIEDGSAPERDGQPRTYRTADGRTEEIPNLEAELSSRVVEAFGLETPESTLEFLEGLGELPVGASRVVAIEAPELPAYYSDDVELSVEIDRGDVWYEFPYDGEGNERRQPVQRRPRITVYVDYAEQRIPIVRFGTTIGGWRSEQIEGERMWRYKNSPVGPRVWSRIASAPVWLPPESTPSRSLLNRVPGRSGAERFRINYHEIGPSYASAYGLVAAYHQRYSRQEDGSVDLRGDEGIRTHGSVDYMSIMRRHSHGCHRLHNHIAVRLMSWVLAHRPHRRLGHSDVAFRRDVPHEDHNYRIAVDQGGYFFELERPVPVRVLEGRVRGRVAVPIEQALPQYDEEIGAYVTPEGGAVHISRSGEMTEYELDAGPPELIDAGVPPVVAAEAAVVGALPEPEPTATPGSLLE